MVVIIILVCLTFAILRDTASNLASQRCVPIPTSFHTTAIPRFGKYCYCETCDFYQMDEKYVV